MRTVKYFSLIFVVLLLLTSCKADEEPVIHDDPPETVEEVDRGSDQIDSTKNKTYDASQNTTPEFFPWSCEDFSIPAGINIGFYYTWATKTEDQNTEYFDVAEHHVYMNDVPIQTVMEGVNGIEQDSDGNYNQLYWIDIGNYPEGTYTLRNEIEVKEPVFDGWDWYGPDTETPMMGSGCTVTVLPASSEVADESEIAPAEADSYSGSCSIASPVRESWETTICETFDSSTELWQGTSQGTTTRLDSGQYIIDNTTTVSQGYTTGYTFPVFIGSASDHMISIDGEIDSNFRDCTWGVFVRSEANQIDYFFMINNQGRYTLTGSTDRDAAKYLGNIDSGSHNAIVWEGVNNITAVAEGRNLEFYINGELITTHEANSTNPINFGLIVWGGEGVSALTRFDNLLVRVK